MTIYMKSICLYVKIQHYGTLLWHRNAIPNSTLVDLLMTRILPSHRVHFKQK